MTSGDSEQDSSQSAIGPGSLPGQSVVYVVAKDAVSRQTDEGIDLVELARIVWAGKWIVAGITALVAGVTIAYALLATEWYRAEVVLAPATDTNTTGLAGQLGDIASLAGVNLGQSTSAEPIAVLQSRELAKSFIEELGLLPVLLSDKWDAEAKRWKEDDPKKWPDVRDGIKYFDDSVLNVSQDDKTGLVTVAIEWTDPEVAAKWANLYVQRLNDRMRKRAVMEAEANIKFLQEQNLETNIVELKEASARLLETELQKLMVARGNQEFSFRVVDAAQAPKLRSWPKRLLLVILGTVLGSIAGVVTVVARRAFRP